MVEQAQPEPEARLTGRLSLAGRGRFKLLSHRNSDPVLKLLITGSSSTGHSRVPSEPHVPGVTVRRPVHCHPGTAAADGPSNLRDCEHRCIHALTDSDS